MSIFNKKIIEDLFYKKGNENQKKCLEENSAENEWIWVDGYKGTDKNMQCRNFQFELGITYKEEKAETCSSGFHLCLCLNDVMEYYNFDFKNRFLFKLNSFNFWISLLILDFCIKSFEFSSFINFFFKFIFLNFSLKKFDFPPKYNLSSFI